MIRKYIGTGIVTLALLFSASPVFAQSTDIATQIAALLSQIKVLQAQIAQLQAQQSGVTCSTFADLKYGDFDDNADGRVSQLQTWLGISSNTFGFGTYGPRTRAAWNSRCGSATTWSGTGSGASSSGTISSGSQTGGGSVPSSGSGTFFAYPSSGLAPLTVNFVAGVDNSSLTNYRVDFGDGQSSALQNNCPGGAIGACGQPSVQHVYAQVGTYAARLLQISTCAIDTTCWIPVLGASSVTISVGSATMPPPTPAPTNSGSGSAQSSSGTNSPSSGSSVSSANFSVTPTLGSAPLTVSFNANAGDANPNTFFIDFGDGSSASAGVLSTQHTYSSAGTYISALKRTAASGGATVSTATITVTSGGYIPGEGCTGNNCPQ